MSSRMGEASMFGVLDFMVLGGMAGLALYYLVLKKKKDKPIEYTKLTAFNPSMQRGTSFDPSFINKMKRTGRNVVVFYGSQTGTGEEFANRLAKDSTRYGMKGMVADPEECSMEDLSQLAEIDNSLAIFCLATYGEGDPTDNAQEFYDWLQESSAELDGVKYAVFGLGNKTYEHYNAMAKYVDNRLEELGAERVYEIGMGDDDANIEEDFVTWKEGFWPMVCEHFGITTVGEDICVRQYSLTVHDVLPTEKLFTGEPARLNSFQTQRPPFDAKNPLLSPITLNRELHKAGDRSCMHIVFDITGSKIRYDAGDHVAVYPINNAELVEKLGKRLGANLGQMFTLTNVDEEASKKHPFPCPTTYQTCLSHYIDITHHPRTNVLKELMEYTDDPKDKEFLQKISSPAPEGRELYNEWIIKDDRFILDVLEDLPSIKPPIDHICELLPRLQPRYYSISSSPKMHPTGIHVTAVLVEWSSRLNRDRKGVTTSWLKKKQPVGDAKPTVPIFVRKSQFRLPFKPSVPVLMIGPGTGVAPFRGFIQDRHVMKKDGKQIGDLALFFGCRNEAEDFIFEDELKKYHEEGTLTKLHVAFSRDQSYKIYVQHLIKKNKVDVWKQLEDGGHIYVCGDARHMAHDVDSALKDVVMEEGKMDEAAAAEYLKKLRSRGRYSCDVWS